MTCRHSIHELAELHKAATKPATERRTNHHFGTMFCHHRHSQHTVLHCINIHVATQRRNKKKSQYTGVLFLWSCCCCCCCIGYVGEGIGETLAGPQGTCDGYKRRVSPSMSSPPLLPPVFRTFPFASGVILPRLFCCLLARNSRSGASSPSPSRRRRGGSQSDGIGRNGAVI